MIIISGNIGFVELVHMVVMRNDAHGAERLSDPKSPSGRRGEAAHVREKNNKDRNTQVLPGVILLQWSGRKDEWTGAERKNDDKV